jgi:integral membrane protein
MTEYFNSPIGRLRLTGLLEGVSLILLMAIGMPMKYVWGNPIWVEIIGPIHGVLFILFVILTLSTSAQYKWKFFPVTAMLLLASFIPFGTFYTDRTILKKRINAPREPSSLA